MRRVQLICIYVFTCFFFSIRVFLHEHSRFTGQQGKRKFISLTPLYQFHPLHRHSYIIRTITEESSPLCIAISPTHQEHLVSKLKSVTTELQAHHFHLHFYFPYIVINILFMYKIFEQRIFLRNWFMKGQNQNSSFNQFYIKIKLQQCHK